MAGPNNDLKPTEQYKGDSLAKQDAKRKDDRHWNEEVASQSEADVGTYFSPCSSKPIEARTIMFLAGGIKEVKDEKDRQREGRQNEP
ncbi:hypothetical protein LTR66_012294 [Elasticomyces elasticus]|nr:hypothetical protein LTR66_012294 [Elasticomyces elasticus]